MKTIKGGKEDIEYKLINWTYNEDKILVIYRVCINRIDEFYCLKKL